MGPTLIDQPWVFLAAVGGAAIPVALSPATSRGRAVVRVLCGTALAVFLAPAITKRYVSDSDADAAVAFLVGCFGLNLMLIVQRVIKTHGEKAIKRFAGLLFRRVGKGDRGRQSGKGRNERIRQGSRGTPTDEGK